MHTKRKNLMNKIQFLRSKLGWLTVKKHQRKCRRELKSAEKALKALDKREPKALTAARKEAERVGMSVWWHYQSKERKDA